MRFRKLRIAWSVVWGLAAVLLIALWVRSYQTCDRTSMTSHLFGVSTEGAFIVAWTDDLRYQRFFMTLMNYPSRTSIEPQKGFLGFLSDWHSDLWYVQTPYWFLVALGVILAAAPWLPRRFTLRTLLIATTLVAVLLGLIVYAVR